jgi:hypothetical protein
MSEEIIKAEEQEILSFDDKINLINEKYINILEELLEKFKYHEEISGQLEFDLKYIKDALKEDKFNIIDRLTDNFLFCFEQITEHNIDYFKYQTDKIKKNGKYYKNKISKLGNKTVFKRVLSELDNKSTTKIFTVLIEMFELLIVKDSENDDSITFINEYTEYVKENFNENKNFSKMIMVFDNVDNMFSNIPDENDTRLAVDIEKEKSKDKKEKVKGKKGKSFGLDGIEGMGEDFIKGLETTKIAQLAKNISQKIKPEDFPILSDPSKLLSSLSNNSEGGDDSGNSIQNLLKFVVGEVEDAFKKENMNEKDLVNEAQNIMGKFQNMSGFNPMSMMGGGDGEGGFDFGKIAEIFSNIKK